MMIYGVPNLRLSKHQVKYVLKAHSGIQPIHFLPINSKPQIILHCKSRPTPHNTNITSEIIFNLLYCSIETSTPGP